MPPTSTGRPRRVGRVSCSTEAKKASMSRCRTHRPAAHTRPSYCGPPTAHGYRCRKLDMDWPNPGSRWPAALLAWRYGNEFGASVVL
ncbi:Uncharacterised protein [Mycobacteroides abscessus subsp. abscessus]|nr:Uncharacterised protein [Mycobacteroides abscessus subsp. abscessus]